MRVISPHKEGSRRTSSGLTLVEIVAVVSITAIIAYLLVSVVSRMSNVGDRARCTANLRALFVGLDSYTRDNNHWPQIPLNAQGDDTQRGEWWIRTLKPYDVSESAWKCPAIARLGAITKEGTSPVIHYDPTQFDDKPRTPYKWQNMPWIIERANVHGRGALMIFPDGSIRDLDQVLEELGS